MRTRSRQGSDTQDGLLHPPEQEDALKRHVTMARQVSAPLSPPIHPDQAQAPPRDKSAQRSRQTGGAVARGLSRVRQGQPEANTVAQKVRPEVQLTAKFLKKEIEAIEARRSTKLSSTVWRLSSAQPQQAVQQRLFIVSAKLPFSVFFDEDVGGFTCEQDPFDLNIPQLLESLKEQGAGHYQDGMVNGNQDNYEVHPREGPCAGVDVTFTSLSKGSRTLRTVLVGTPTVRRRKDGSIMDANEIAAIQDELEHFLKEHYEVVPVFPPTGRDNYTQVLYATFHYAFPTGASGWFGGQDWDGYILVNEAFRDAIMSQHKRGDLVWINDYTLMLLPKLLREERPDISIGFFLHCVFPGSEVYRMLPQREELLRGVLSSNFIGLHNFQFVRRFLTSCTWVLGLECTTSSIEACEDAGGTSTRIVAVPLGLDLQPYREVLSRPSMDVAISRLMHSFGNKKILFAVDRLEERSGLPYKLMAFHKFLQKEPAWASKCLFIQIVEPAAEDTYEVEAVDGEDYKPCLLHQVYEMVGEVNSKFGTIGHLPIHFMCQEFSKADLIPLYSKAHVMVDTSLSDLLARGAHEYLCCQDEQHCGVLILSEFAGSALSLRAGAVTVNPFDTNGFADAIQEALEMDLHDRRELIRYGKRYVTEYTLQRWATVFLQEFLTAESESEMERVQIPPQLDHDRLVTAVREASHRLIVLGFEGSLQRSKELPRLHPRLQTHLRDIADDPNTHVIVLSNSPREVVETAMGDVRCWILAEAGACHKEPQQGEWQEDVDPSHNYEWMDPVRHTMQYFTARTPGSRVVETTTSVSWQFRKNGSVSDHCALQSKDLLIHLWAGPLLSAPAEVSVDSDCVCVRPTGLSNASQLEKTLQKICYKDGRETPSQHWAKSRTCVMCIGDFFSRDEDLYTTLQRFFLKRPEGTPSRVPEDKHEPSDHSKDTFFLDSYDGPVHSSQASRGRDHGGRLQRSQSDDEGFGHEDDDDRQGGGGLMEQSHSHGFYKRRPSLPDRGGPDVIEAPKRAISGSGGAEEDESNNEPAMFLCTVGRKTTRANYYLTSTSDVAFLFAQLARALREEREVVDTSH
eukprot:TRINITY_DN57080_c0_g1_i1.p1 TRINITY_DN57080_c0_g1~~TRINITY_DN57080_c0_g1_i1.p1  ORF type:complete len:1079 (+),score=248.44 TRINITY_DN57080_c0_g1_i1:126-3362(+)